VDGSHGVGFEVIKEEHDVLLFLERENFVSSGSDTTKN
jgi:hypothetical protein